ncbi:hypothetical protein OIU84_027018 [Salix udensis]|uniref:Senescence domain-containing protein n=1 Tax=Salix udensis TaxID=889485 RepID=A0AAD6KEM3_9ROSI|nr:hypothetical protein OIU84_027018 [Salix udensis]
MEHNRQRIPFNTKAIKSFHSNFIESLAFVNDHSCQNELGDINCNFYKDWDSSVGTIDELHLMGRGKLKLLESYNISDVEEGIVNSADQFAENTDSLIPPVEPEITSTIDITPENPSLGSDSLEMDNDSLSSANAGFDEFLSGVRDSINTSVNKGGNVVQISLDTITSSITSFKEGASEAVDDALSKIFSTFDQTGELAGDRLTSFSSGLREATKKAAGTSVDVLGGAIIAVEESITKGASFVVYSHGSAKDLLPPEIRDALNLSEERVTEIDTEAYWCNFSTEIFLLETSVTAFSLQDF